MTMRTPKGKLDAFATADADAGVATIGTTTTRSVRMRQLFFFRRQQRPTPRRAEQQQQQQPPLNRDRSYDEPPPQSSPRPPPQQEPSEPPAPGKRNTERQVATRNVLEDNDDDNNDNDDATGTTAEAAEIAAAAIYERLGAYAWQNMGRTRGGDGLQYLQISNNGDDHNTATATTDHVFHFGATNTRQTVDHLVEGVTKFTGYAALGECYHRFGGREGLLERAASQQAAAVNKNSSHSNVPAPSAKATTEDSVAAAGVPLQHFLNVVSNSSNTRGSITTKQTMPSQQRFQTGVSDQNREEEELVAAVLGAPIRDERTETAAVSAHQKHQRKQQKLPSEVAAAAAPTTPVQVLGAVSVATSDANPGSSSPSQGLGLRNHLAASLAYTTMQTTAQQQQEQRHQTWASPQASARATRKRTPSKMTLLAAAQASVWCNEETATDAGADESNTNNGEAASSKTSCRDFGRDATNKPPIGDGGSPKPPGAAVVRDTVKQSIAKLEREIFGEQEACCASSSSSSSSSSDLMTRLRRVERTVLGREEPSGGMISRIHNLERLVGIAQV